MKTARSGLRLPIAKSSYLSPPVEHGLLSGGRRMSSSSLELASERERALLETWHNGGCSSHDSSVGSVCWICLYWLMPTTLHLCRAGALTGGADSHFRLLTLMPLSDCCLAALACRNHCPICRPHTLRTQPRERSRSTALSLGAETPVFLPRDRAT